MGCIMCFNSQSVSFAELYETSSEINFDVIWSQCSQKLSSKPSSESKCFNLLEELKPEDDIIRRKNAIKRHLTKHIPNYLVDVVLRFLGTRDYSLITKPKYTISGNSLTYPGGVVFIKQKLLAVGYYYGQITIWDIKSQELIREQKFDGQCSTLLTFGSLIVCLMRYAKILILDSNLNEIGQIKFPGRSEGIAISERSGWIAITKCIDGEVIFFDIKLIEKNVLEPKAVMRIDGFNWPTGICFNQDSTLLAVCERRSNQVSLYSFLKKEVLFSFGSNTLLQPNDVKLDTDRNFLVYDTGNRRLCIFDQEGTFLLSVLDGFFRDTGNTYSRLVVDASGTVAVTDDDAHQVFIF